MYKPYFIVISFCYFYSLQEVSMREMYISFVTEWNMFEGKKSVNQEDKVEKVLYKTKSWKMEKN